KATTDHVGMVQKPTPHLLRILRKFTPLTTEFNPPGKDRIELIRILRFILKPSEFRTVIDLNPRTQRSIAALMPVETELDQLVHGRRLSPVTLRLDPGGFSASKEYFSNHLPMIDVQPFPPRHLQLARIEPQLVQHRRVDVGDVVALF